MIRVRKARDRGHFDHGWLSTYHTFSFAGYQDPYNMGFRTLRVMNEDWVAPGQGFGKHPHRDMEIVTYVLAGALEHKDSMGNGETLRSGEFQRMSAGSGILHSEFNPSSNEPVHLYQIWLYPEEKGIEPSYEQKNFPSEDRQNRLQLVASPDAAEGSLRIHQDARIYLAELVSGATVEHSIPTERHVWLQVLRGSVDLNGKPLETSDGAAISFEKSLKITAAGNAEVMLFEMN
ncbi:pirin family protein [Blastopirellula sp. JC732]|uniref:Pirin family protein n=1 Tax=Blastopirellula sediminis TaxID=2894196 RepID=A0A9X1MPJ1_9BACT|nr:pirin family protein [Blastopirellula sediminis]MCC9605717.1 pirin family protein [Blastopirellula sediminis]MCC9630983.1 pirin family protein [Blastopirellula sediminis]